MADKADVLKNEIEKILSNQKANQICVLVNTDDYSGKFVKISGGKVFLIDETELEVDKGHESLERLMIEHYGFSKNDFEDFLCVDSEINRKLRVFIKSNRLMNSTIIDGMSCQAVEDVLATVKGNLTILVSKIQEKIISGNLEDVCYLICGKMSGNYLVERYLRESLSYDADLADSKLYINPAIVDVEVLSKKKVLDVIRLVLHEKGKKIKKINLESSNDRDKDYFGPIYVVGTSEIKVEVENELCNIKLPFQLDDNSAELIELKLWNEENSETILLVKRLKTTEVFEILL